MSLRALLNDTCVVLTQVQGEDANTGYYGTTSFTTPTTSTNPAWAEGAWAPGAWAEGAWATASESGTPVLTRCTIQQGGTTEAIQFGKLTGRNTYTGFFLFGEGPAKPGDRITWRGRTLECVGYPMDKSGKRHHYETVLAEPVDE